LEQSHHHEVHGSYWVTPCLRIVGPLRCRIWSTRSTSYCFFSSSHSFPAPLAQYPRPRSSPSLAVVTLSSRLTAGPRPPPSCCPLSSFSPPSCRSFSPRPSTSGWCSIWIWSCFCTCPSSFGCSPFPSSFGCSPCPSSFCWSSYPSANRPRTSSNPCNSFQPVPRSG